MDTALEDRLIQTVHAMTIEKSREEWETLQSASDSPVFDYRFDHLMQVVKVAKFLAKKLDADLEIITMAGWLHDLAKPGMGGVMQHGKKSAQLARKILAKEGQSDNTIRQVCDVIEKHVGLTLERPLDSLEAQILWEADKIVKLGTTGLIHFIINGIRIKPGMNMTSIKDEIASFIPLAENIVKSMVTVPGNELALKRLQTIKDFTKSLEGELNIEE